MRGVPTPDPALQLMRLIWSVDHEMLSVSKRMETTLGLTIPQRMTLLLVGRHPDILASEIAAWLHLHPGTVSGIVRRLERGGYLRRTGHADDGRRQRLTLTPLGRKANSRRSGTFEGAVRKVLTDTSEGELAAVEKLLTRLASELRVIAQRRP